MNKTWVPIVLLLIGLGAGFYGGMQYRNYQLSKARGNFAAGNGTQRFIGQNGQRPGGQNGEFRNGAVAGSILSMDDKSITVKLNDGSTKIVLFSDSTTYNNTVTAAKTDLKVGDNVAVFGTPNSDGSVTAQSVQLNPEFRFGASPAPAGR